MKKLSIFVLLAFIMMSCSSNFSNVKKEDICGKRFTSSYPSSTVEGVSTDTGTTLNCNGTFESGAVRRMTGQNSVNENHYTGTWEIVNEISDEVKYAVKRYGIEDDNYSIIKYSSSNGVTDYCVYYPSSFDGSPTLGTLNISCSPDNAGIHDGSL